MAFKVGILGLGAIAKKMAETINQMDGVCLYAVASRELEKAEEFAKEYQAEKAYGSYEALMEDDAVELIYIATPHAFHYEQARACIDHGKPVLVEKAFTLNARQAMQLCDYAESKDVFLCEAMWVRFMPLVQTLLKVLDKEVIGEITAVSCNTGYAMTHKERLMQPYLGGGALLDVGIYPLTFAIMVLGKEIDTISTSVIKMNTGVDAQSFINIAYTWGALASVHSTMLSNTANAGTIFGTKGKIEVENINTFESFTIYNEKNEVVEKIDCPKKISGYEYEVLAAMKAIAQGDVECSEMPHNETVYMMQLMDYMRNQWNMKYPGE